MDNYENRNKREARTHAASTDEVIISDAPDTRAHRGVGSELRGLSSERDIFTEHHADAPHQGDSLRQSSRRLNRQVSAEAETTPSRTGSSAAARTSEAPAAANGGAHDGTSRASARGGAAKGAPAHAKAPAHTSADSRRARRNDGSRGSASESKGSHGYNGGSSFGGFVFLICVLAAIIIALVVVIINPAQYLETADETTELITTAEQTTAVTTAPETEKVVNEYFFPEGLYSRQALLYDYTDNAIIAELGASDKVYPASLTKMMTVLVAIENIPDLDAKTTLSSAMFATLLEQNASIAGFSENESVCARDLLYAAMLPSGADGSIGLAELVSGSESAFAVLMNNKAKELGMKDTHYVNVTGLHDPEHYTTAYDQLKLMKYAMKNDTFREVISTPSYTSSPTDIHPSGVTMRSTVFSGLSANGLDSSMFVGGKTGYTPEAGLCLASIATVDGHTCFLITFGAGAGLNTPSYHVMDAFNVFSDYANPTPPDTSEDSR